jgi:restriction system protein
MDSIKKSDPKFYATMLGSMYYRRLLLLAIKRSKLPPWEGITWILDLLPHFPRKALEGLNAYILAHAQQLPDGRLSGLYEVSEIIRAKFIGMPGTTSDSCKVLVDLKWRDFEILIEELYKEMGYETQLTPPQKDNGRDIIASRKESGKLEHLRIECKRYSEEAVGLKFVQRLLGVVSDEKVNKGVLVTTSRFTKPAQECANKNPRIELINGEQLVLLLNEYLGARWTLQIERLISRPLDQTV